MIHRVSHKKLSRDTNARRSLLKNLASSLVLHEKIVTTETKAKATRPYVEKLITKAKEDSLNSQRYLSARLNRENVVRKLLEIVGPTFKERRGGYTRVIKLPPRVGDAAPMAVLEFVEDISQVAAKKKLAQKPTKPPKRDAKTKPPKKTKKPVAIKQARSKKPTVKKETDRKK